MVFGLCERRLKSVGGVVDLTRLRLLVSTAVSAARLGKAAHLYKSPRGFSWLPGDVGECVLVCAVVGWKRRAHDSVRSQRSLSILWEQRAAHEFVEDVLNVLVAAERDENHWSRLFAERRHQRPRRATRVRAVE